MTPTLQTESLMTGTNGMALPVATTVAPAPLRVSYRAKLSVRELETLNFVSYGLTSPEIAEQLNLSRETIETHRKNIIRKLKASNIVEAVAYSIRHKIIE